MGVTRAGGISKTQCVQVGLQLRRLIEKIQPDIVHANNFHAMIVSSLIRRWGGPKLLWHVRDVPRSGLLYKWCVKKADRTVAVSEYVRKLMLIDGANIERVCVIHNGTDIPEDIPNHNRSEKAHFVFASVGQMVEWKNQEQFLEAAEIVHRKCPQSQFLIIGDDVFGRDNSYANSLKAKAASRQMSYVKFLGWQEEMSHIWPKIDCLVHTAMQEPFGRVLIEAMSYAKPVVAFDSGGPMEILSSGKIGQLVPCGDISHLARVMLRLAHDRQLAVDMGRAGRLEVQNRFSARQTAENVLNVYQKVLST